MSQREPNPQDFEGYGIPDAVEAEAIYAIREPIEWIEDTVIWLIEANMVERAQRAYTLWIELQQEREAVLNQMVYDAVQQGIQDFTPDETVGR